MGKERMLVTGGHALEGQVRVSGGKNTAVAVIPATLLCDEPCTIENLPDIEDVHALADAMGMNFNPGMEFVDLYINGSYRGFYLLKERVTVDSKRINIKGISILLASN